MNKNITRKTIAEVEAIIEAEIAALIEEYDLDCHDIQEIRDEAYKANGWRYDPFPEIEEDDVDAEYEEEFHCRTMSEMLWEIGMRESDFL